MPADVSAVGYVIWGSDRALYGPVELPTLVEWIKDERVLADTWLFTERNGSWEKAVHVPELQMFFHRGHLANTAASPSTARAPELRPAALRHIRILGGLNDEQLERLLELAEVRTFPAGSTVAKQGEPAQSMGLILEGELRARTMSEGYEVSLGNLGAGEFFGEMALFDHGPRCQDIIAVKDSTLLILEAAEFEKLTYDAPEIAAPLLHSLTKTLATRFRSETKRYRDSISFIRPAGR